MAFLQDTQLNLNLETFTILTLDVLRRTDTLEITLDHDAKPCGKSLSLFH
jgi:hypothetical protein